MRKMLIPIALAATMACSAAQAQTQERERGERRTDGWTRGDATQMQGRDGASAPRTRAAADVDRIDARQARQAARIRSGVESGDLTRRETRALRNEQRGIRHLERHARADGVVTPRESRRLERAQDRASRHINQQRHDRQQRGHAYAYGRGHDRGNHYAYGRGHNRGNHYAYGRGHGRGSHYGYGHRFNHRPAHGANSHRFQHRSQFASRGHFGRR